jgi:arylsulfatase A-like enzyme
VAGQAAEKKPNIVVIFGDDIGYWNLGVYTHGMMGRTPHIDSLASTGMLFTDHYGQPSCTAGRAAFIMGQMPIRTGMTTIGIPGSARGIQKTDPTLAEVLKALGYATAQFGKNHLGDRNEFLPTVHGFDEWFGNLYHLNAEEEPEELDYPGKKHPEYTEKFGPRGALHTWATDTDDPTTDAKFGRVGKQKIEDTGAILKKLDDLGVADNTIVVYSTDNGNELLFWPDGGYAPFRGEKGCTWEGGMRVPCLVRWPGHVKPGSVGNGVQSHEDLYVTLAAAAGLPNLKQDLLKGYKMGATTYKVHLDGYDNTDYWTGKSEKSARREIYYYDETDLMAVRVDGWKMHIGVKHHGLWWDEKSYPSVPYVVNLLMDPMEKMTPDSEEYQYIGRKFFASKLWAPTAAGPLLAAHLKSLEEFPPSQGTDTLSMKKALDEAMKKLENPHGSSN